MKLNKKGVTLVELIVSIGLLSIIMAFLFKIILDVKYEKNLSGLADNNQINRAEIIKTIQDDLINQELTSYYYSYIYGNQVFFRYDTINKSIQVSGNTLTYSDRKWTIKDADYRFGNIEVSTLGDSYVKIVIPVISDLEEDSSIDDIEILFKIQ